MSKNAWNDTNEVDKMKVLKQKLFFAEVRPVKPLTDKIRDVTYLQKFNYTEMFTVETNLFMWYNLMGMPVIFFIFKKRERKPEK